MCIYRVEGESKVEISRKVNCDLSLERSLFIDEYKSLYRKDDKWRQFGFDFGVKLEGKMDPIIFLVEQKDYSMIMKCLFFNITYDDTMDERFFSDYEAVMQGQLEPALPVDINIVFDNFTLLLNDSKEGLPFSMINLNAMKLVIAREPSRAIKIKIIASQINGSYFVLEDDGFLIEKKMLGALDTVNDYNTDLKSKEEIVEEIVQSTIQYAHKIAQNHLNFESNSKQDQVVVDIQITPAKDKFIKLSLSEMKMYLITSTYLKLLLFLKLDPSTVQPPPRVLARPSISSPQRNNPPQTNLTISMEIFNILIIIPSTGAAATGNPQHVLALKGDMSIVFAKYPEPNLQDLYNDVQKKKITKAVEQCAQFNEIGRIGLTVHKLQVFVCEFEDLINSKNFNQVKKRNMVLPFSLILVRKTHQVLNKERTLTNEISRAEINIERVVTRISYQDVKLIHNSIQFQLEQIKQGAGELLLQLQQQMGAPNEEEKVPEVSPKSAEEVDENLLFECVVSNSSPTSSPTKTIVEESKSNFDRTGKNGNASLLAQQENNKESIDDWQPGYQEINLSSKGIQLVIINDVDGSLVPIVEFTIFRLYVNLMKLPEKLQLGGFIEMNCSYFNPTPSKWEPFVEKFALDFSLFKGENPKVSLVVSSSHESEEINFNISEQMISILYSTILSWKKNYQQKKVTVHGRTTITNISTKQQQQEEDTIDFVSPYTIINNTGYPVEVSADNSGLSKESSPRRKGSTQIQSYLIENRGITQYMVESDVNQIFERSMHEMFIHSNKIRVKVLHPKLEITPINGVDLDKPRVKQYLVSTPLDAGDLVIPNYCLYTVVKIEQNKKVLTLSSAIKIINNVFKPYFIILEANGESLEMKLDQGESLSVPLDFTEGTFSIKEDMPDAIPSPKCYLNRLIDAPEKIQEFQSGPNSFILAKSVQIDKTSGYHEISLLPPFEIKNCCALELFYRISDSHETIYETSTLRPQEMLHETKTSSQQPLYLQIRLQGYYWSHKFLIQFSGSNNKSNKVQVKDARGGHLDILVFVPDEELGTKKLFLYTKTCIVNETSFELQCFSVESGKPLLIPGQFPTDAQEVFNPRLTLFNEASQIALSRRKEKESSKPIPVGSMGSTSAELISENGSTLLDIGVHMSLLRCDRDYNLFTKIITFTPRFVLLNKTDGEIEIKREQGQKVLMTLKKETRTPLYWNDWVSTLTQKNIAIRYLEPNENQDKWAWSQPFDIQSIGLYHYLIQTTEKGQKKFFKTSVILENSTIFLVIEEEKPEQVTFKVRNECLSVDILVYQTDVHPSNGVTLKTGETIPWAWTFPNKKKEISACFSVGSLQNYHAADFKFSFDQLNTEYSITIPINKERSINLRASAIVEGPVRVLKFYFISKVEKRTLSMQLDNQQRNLAQNVINLNVELSIKKFGISIVSSLTKNKKKKLRERKEVLYLQFRGIEFRMVHSNTLLSSQFRLKYMNIDNNTSYDTSFPVLMTPTKPDDLLNLGKKKYFLDVLIKQKMASDVTFFETIQFLLDASTLRVDGSFLNAMLEVVNNFRNILDLNRLISGSGTIAQRLYHGFESARKLEYQNYFVTQYEWLKKPLSEFAGGNLYVKKMVLNAMFFNISFQLKKIDNSAGFFLFNLITSVFGTALANLDDAPLTMSGIVLENVFDSREAIMKKIGDKYKDEVMKSIPQLLGSLDIVGNPVGLFKNISTGVIDLVEKPVEGFLQGPLEGGKGLMLGAGSLMKNTVSGTFNSIGKVTGSLASGLSNLAMDDEYMTERERSRIKRPKDVGEGVVKGMTSLVMGLGEGVAGVFVKPIVGAQNKGIKGFFKGALQGVTGLIVKPVAGILDAASNTAEGIKNTATAFDQRPNEHRVRYPRAFYGKEKYYRTYIETDAEILWLFHFAEASFLKDLAILSAYDVFPNEKDTEKFFILVIAFEAILWWGVQEKKIEWIVPSKHLEKATHEKGGLILHLKNDQMRESTMAIRNCDSVQNAFIHKKIQELIDYVKQDK